MRLQRHVSAVAAAPATLDPLMSSTPGSAPRRRSRVPQGGVMVNLKALSALKNGRATALRRRSAMVLAALAFAATALLGLGTPAYADENGSEWCFLSTGSITVRTGSATAPASVPYGTNLSVAWNV